MVRLVNTPGKWGNAPTFARKEQDRQRDLWSKIHARPLKALWSLALIRGFAVLCILVTSTRAAPVSEECAMDLEAIPVFLVENDAGAKEELAQWGQPHFDKALREAREEVARVQDREGCRTALDAYLKAWRKGHLLVANMTPSNAPASGAVPDLTSAKVDSSLVPTIKPLSDRTVLLTIPTFASEYRQPLIRLIAQHRQELITHTNWIIDVRGNDGGDDATYYPLLSWLLPDEREDIGAESRPIDRQYPMSGGRGRRIHCWSVGRRHCRVA